jgi:hypothetical protein
MRTAAEEQLRVTLANLDITRSQVKQLEADRDALKAQIPNSTPVNGAAKDVARLLRTVRISKSCGGSTDAYTHSLVTTDEAKASRLRELNPAVPGVHVVSFAEFKEIVELQWGEACE